MIENKKPLQKRQGAALAFLTGMKMKLVPRPGFFGGVAAVVDAEDEAVGGGVNLSADGLAMTNPLLPPPEAPPVG